MKLLKYSQSDLEVLTDVEFENCLLAWDSGNTPYCERIGKGLPRPIKFPYGTPPGWDRLDAYWHIVFDMAISVHRTRDEVLQLDKDYNERNEGYTHWVPYRGKLGMDVADFRKALAEGRVPDVIPIDEALERGLVDITNTLKPR